MKVTFKKDEYVLLDDTNKIIANYIVTKGAKGDTGAGEDNIIEDVKVNNNSLPVTSKSVNIDLTGYVEKETGKGLSTNDYTTTEKNKLAGIESSADVNIIENIKVNGVAQTITNKAVDVSVPTNTSDLNNDSNFVTPNDLSSVATSGSYTDLSDKPTEQLVNVGTEVDEDYRVNVLKGKNLLSTSLELGTFSNEGVKAGSTTNYRTANMVKVKPNTTYTTSINGTAQAYPVYFYTSSGTFINSTTTATFTTPANCEYLNFRCFNADFTSDFANLKVQLEEGSTATSYEPYIVPSINVDGEEIYGQQYCNSSINSDATITSGSSTYSTQQLLLDKISTYGNFSLSSNSIVIGKGIKQILVSLNINIFNATDNHFYNPSIRLYRDGTRIDQINCPRYMRNIQGSYSISPYIFDVQENDVIKCEIQIGSASETFKVSKDGTNLLIQKIK